MTPKSLLHSTEPSARPRSGRARRGVVAAISTIAALLTAMLLLGACGVQPATPGNSGGSQSQSVATHAPPTRASTANNPLVAALGCKEPTGSTPPAASVMLPADHDASAVPVKVGDVVEVDLPSQFGWMLRRVDSADALATLNAVGVLDSAHHTCAWRFQAKSPGTVTITFVGIPQCPANKMCPTIALDRTYSLNIHA